MKYHESGLLGSDSLCLPGLQNGNCFLGIYSEITSSSKPVVFCFMFLKVSKEREKTRQFKEEIRCLSSTQKVFGSGNSREKINLFSPEMGVEQSLDMNKKERDGRVGCGVERTSVPS